MKARYRFRTYSVGLFITVMTVPVIEVAAESHTLSDILLLAQVDSPEINRKKAPTNKTIVSTVDADSGQKTTIPRIKLVIPPRKGSNDKKRVVSFQEMDRIRKSNRSSQPSAQQSARQSPPAAAAQEYTEVACEGPFTGFLNNNTLKPQVKIVSSLNREQTLASGNEMAGCYGTMAQLIQFSNPFASAIAFTVIDGAGQLVMKKSAPIAAKRKMKGNNEPAKLLELVGRWRLYLSMLDPTDKSVSHPFDIRVSWNWTASRFEAILVKESSESHKHGFKLGETILTSVLAGGSTVVNDNGTLGMQATVNSKLAGTNSSSNPIWGLLADGSLMIAPVPHEKLEGYSFKRVR